MEDVIQNIDAYVVSMRISWAFLANCASLTLWFPQAIKTIQLYKNKEYLALNSISMLTQIITVIGTTSWMLYGVALRDWWLIFGFFITFPLAIMTILLKIRAKKYIKKNNVIDQN